MPNLIWQRRRHPDDVPTPVAVAVSDFCRRAKAPAPPAAVREALALVAEGDDFRLRELADSEPRAWPLGPLAVVDVINGADQALAAQREQTGYYQLARTLVEAQAQGAPPLPPPPAGEPAPAQPPPAPRASAKAPRKKKAPAPTLAEQIAPRRRSAEPPAAEAATAPPPAPPPGPPRRQLPEPRGRFARVESSKAPLDELWGPAGHDVLATLVEQTGNRFALRRHLEQGYVSRRGRGVMVGDVLAALARQRLQPQLERLEREAVLSALTDNRGALARAAHALGMTDAELEQLIGDLGLAREVGEIRERFVREALSARNLPLRLDLVGRSRYLEDLGIEPRFREALERDLRALLDEAPAGEEAEARVAGVARRHGLNPELLRKAMDKLGLTGQDT